MKQRHHLGFALLGLLSVFLWWGPLTATFRLALGSDEYTHILMVLPLSASLICFDWKILRIAAEPRARAGLVLLAAALLITGLARWGLSGIPHDLQLSLSMLALVIWWIGSFLFCFGARTFRALLFPLCFLLWIVPFPELALNRTVSFLQNGSVFVARVLFLASGVPVTQDGIMLSIPGMDIEVTPECSSIRSSLMLVITTMVLAHLFLRSCWRKALVIVAAIPLSVAKNGLRIFVIAELGTRVDPGFLDGEFHRHGGIVFLAVALAAVAVLVWILHRTETPRVRTT